VSAPRGLWLAVLGMGALLPAHDLFAQRKKELIELTDTLVAVGASLLVTRDSSRDAPTVRAPMFSPVANPDDAQKRQSLWGGQTK